MIAFNVNVRQVFIFKCQLQIMFKYSSRSLSRSCVGSVYVSTWAVTGMFERHSCIIVTTCHFPFTTSRVFSVTFIFENIFVYFSYKLQRTLSSCRVKHGGKVYHITYARAMSRVRTAQEVWRPARQLSHPSVLHGQLAADTSGVSPASSKFPLSVSCILQTRPV